MEEGIDSGETERCLGCPKTALQAAGKVVTKKGEECVPDSNSVVQGSLGKPRFGQGGAVGSEPFVCSEIHLGK